MCMRLRNSALSVAVKLSSWCSEHDDVHSGDSPIRHAVSRVTYLLVFVQNEDIESEAERAFLLQHDGACVQEAVSSIGWQIWYNDEAAPEKFRFYITGPSHMGTSEKHCLCRHNPAFTSPVRENYQCCSDRHSGHAS
jgi:hypothetical protein